MTDFSEGYPARGAKLYLHLTHQDYMRRNEMLRLKLASPLPEDCRTVFETKKPFQSCPASLRVLFNVVHEGVRESGWRSIAWPNNPFPKGDA